MCIAVVYGVRFFIQSSQSQLGVSESVRVKGESAAPLQVTEFIDFQCPACASGAKYLKKFMEEHPSAVHLEMKYYPLKMHKHAFLSARYAECAGQQGKFWPFHDYMIKQQKQWSQLEEAKEAFDFIAQKVNLDFGKLERCLEDEELMKIIQKDKEEGKVLGVRSTPTYFINGEIVVGTKMLKEKLRNFVVEKTGE